MVSTPRSVQVRQTAALISPEKAIGHMEIVAKNQLEQRFLLPLKAPLTNMDVSTLIPVLIKMTNTKSVFPPVFGAFAFETDK